MNASIIIPAYNSCERLHLNLLSLNYQDYARELFEVIVVNNGSDDNTISMLSSFVPNYKMKVINSDVNKGRAAARNIGIENSKGEILIFHDSDMIATKEYVSSHIKMHKNERTVLCGPGWKRINSFYYRDFNGYLRRNFINGKWMYKDKYSNCKAAERIQLLDEEELKYNRFLKKSFNLDFREKKLKRIVDTFGEDLLGYNFPWRFFMTNNSSIHRKAVEDIGLFDENYINWGCEDLDFAYRLYKNGYSFKRTDSVISVHQEHPVSKQQHAEKNIYYFTKKYNTIDIMLFYYGRFDTLDDLWLSYAIDEFNAFAADKKYDEVADAFKNMLCVVRECCISCSRTYCDINNRNKRELVEQSKELYKKRTFRHFLQVFNLLYKEVYGIDIRLQAPGMR